MDREKIASKVITFVPYMFKRITKILPALDISKQQLGLLFHICKESGKPMSYYSEKMMIPKSNITVITDKLIKEGYINRNFDASDRRVIILSITERGKTYLGEQKCKVEKAMISKLAVLSDAEITRLGELIEEIESIADKLE